MMIAMKSIEHCGTCYDEGRATDEMCPGCRRDYEDFLAECAAEWKCDKELDP